MIVHEAAWCESIVSMHLELREAVERATDQSHDAKYRGLSSRAASDRLRHDGANELPIEQPLPAWRQLVAQLTHFFRQDDRPRDRAGPRNLRKYPSLPHVSLG